jgi:hypothetical protein
MAEVPNIFHFVFGLRPQTEAFHIVHYLCLKSCLEINKPDVLHFHCHHEPFGPLWDRIRSDITLHRVSPEEFVAENSFYSAHQEGRFIKAGGMDYAHHSDFLRLKILLEHGGVYADMDTLFVNPLPVYLFDQQFVLGEERPVEREPGGAPMPSLCNALIMAAPGAEFARLWLKRMYQVFDGTWNRHSCQEAARMWETATAPLYVAPEHFFYKHGWTPEGIHALFEGLDADFSQVYSMHLWSHLWWDEWRTDFTTFCAGMLTEEHIRQVDTTYNVVARRYLPD